MGLVKPYTLDHIRHYNIYILNHLPVEGDKGGDDHIRCRDLERKEGGRRKAEGGGRRTDEGVQFML